MSFKLSGSTIDQSIQNADANTPIWNAAYLLGTPIDPITIPSHGSALVLSTGPLGNTWTSGLATGATGPAGETGLRGVGFFTGIGAPGLLLGNNGDSYLNVINGDTYQYSGAWVLIGNFRFFPE